jgi:hypothetical protein
MSTTASTVGGPNALAIAGGSAEFFFYVTGPGNAPVPLIFSATGTTSVTGGQAYGQVEVVSPGGGLNACSATGPYASTCSNVPQPSAFSSALPFSLAPNALSDVTITIACNLETTGTCAASVDPMIEIDPTFVDASQYTLVFSPAVGGTGAPEAASLAMLGIGGLVFVGMYKRKVST